MNAQPVTTAHTRGLFRLALRAATLLAFFVLLNLRVPTARAAPTALLVVDRSDDAAGLPCTAAANDCTLRSAIQIANSNGVADTITFAASYAITLSSSLPELTANGTCICTLLGQTVTINGNNVAGNVFKISGSDVTLDGLRIYGSGSGYSNIWIRGSAQRVIISNNVIGDDDNAPGGCGVSPHSYSGIYISSTGAVAPGDARAWIYGNLIKCNQGNPGDGIDIVGTNNVVIGADAAGNAGTAQQNFIHSNSSDGVHIELGASYNTVRNSSLYSNAVNGLGIDDSSNNTVRDSQLYCNDQNGIGLYNGASYTIIRNSALYCNVRYGLYIVDSSHNAMNAGVGSEGNSVANNTLGGIYVTGNSTGNTIQAREIEANGGAGVAVVGSNATGNVILIQGTIQGNGGLPIDLGNDGHTPNDPGDADTGPNTLLNYPVITSASGSNINGTACASCLIDIYRAIRNPAAGGGGGIFLTTVAANSSGVWSADLSTWGLTAADITLVATNTLANASEMSPRPQVLLPLILK